VVGQFGRGKSDTQQAAAHIPQDKSTAWLAHASPRRGAHGGSTGKKRWRKQIDSWKKSWAKKFRPTFFHFLMCLRMVSVMRPFAITIAHQLRQPHCVVGSDQGQVAVGSQS